ncbi:RNA polymerase factor sigma-54 [Dolosigranulum pigrum]
MNQDDRMNQSNQLNRSTTHWHQSMGLLQLERVDVSHYIHDYMMENPLVKLESDDELDHTDRADGYDVELHHSQLTLFEFIVEQVELFYRKTPLHEVVMWWVRQLDTDGYVMKSVEEGMNETGQSEVMVIDGLTLLQQLDPPGIGARDLREALMLQVERLDEAPPLTYEILKQQFDALVNRRFSEVTGEFGIELEDVQQVFQFVQKLSPVPASLYIPPRTEMVYPELEVIVQDGQISVRETPYKTPLIEFDQAYYEELKAIDKPSVQSYIQAKKQEFDQLNQALQERREIIKRVGTAIVMAQSDYFLQEDAPLQTIHLSDLAQQLQLSVGTISRAIRGTYLQTTHGTVALKSLLSKRSVVDNQTQAALREAIEALIASEDKQAPLSDQQIAQQLAEQAQKLSRQGVMKYREQLGIGSSHARRQQYEDGKKG